ncbi:bifunctional diguanylate cyclase/phosphodiesterase [Ancylobacter sp. TS-1]|uniref:putative bifunctional diguanylate cyclase/phosphodiesterase n=1 Tax=Ancylobacter sp. TS-1 TaxID=1850374 RepID=UPI001265BF4D|nr:EAL domain-containing protein [Ancylobacter sp. TS-1]QFR33795.1 EAL domain-containing protein [Ancylobacter sp. TS-1]
MSAEVYDLSLHSLGDGLERNLLLLALAALLLVLFGNMLRAMPALPRTLAGGVLAGGTAAASLLFPIWEDGLQVLDLKIVPLILVGPIFGPPAAAVAGAIAIASRALLFGVTAHCLIAIGGATVSGALVAWRLGWRFDPWRSPTRRFASGHAFILAALALAVAGGAYWGHYRQIASLSEHALATYVFLALTTPLATLLFGMLYIFEEQQRRTRMTLAATQARLSTIGDNLPGVLYQRAVGPNGELAFKYVSSRARDVLGVPAEELVAHPGRLLELVHPEDRPILLAAIAKAAEGGTEPLDNEYRIIRPDGQVRWLRVRSQLTHRDRLTQDKEMVAEGIAFDITAQKEAEQAALEARQRHEWLFTHDMLTGLLNRHALLQRIDAHLASPSPHAALLLIDLSQSALVNEFFGAEAGDDRLREAAQRLVAIAPADAAVARTGGDSFAVYLAGLPDEDVAHALRIAESIAERMATPLVRDGQGMPMAVRIGISYGPEQGTDGPRLFRAASIALESARDGAGYMVAAFTPAMESERAEQRLYDDALRTAIAAGELTLVYQPVVTTTERSVVGFEALVRWTHPTLGEVPPGEFVARAEATGLWAALDRFVLTRACTEARHWAGEPWLSVNLSAAWFEIGDVVSAVWQVLETTGFPAGRLQVEITERILIERYDAAIGVINRLHDLGVAVSIDDFGTFYSSLGYLHRLPIDKIKLDRSFALDVDRNARTQAVVESVLSLCHRLDIEVVAEGVETEPQYAWLAIHGCPLVQGFLTGRPGPAPGQRDSLSG